MKKQTIGEIKKQSVKSQEIIIGEIPKNKIGEIPNK